MVPGRGLKPYNTCKTFPTQPNIMTLVKLARQWAGRMSSLFHLSVVSCHYHRKAVFVKALTATIFTSDDRDRQYRLQYKHTELVLRRRVREAASRLGLRPAVAGCTQWQDWLTEGHGHTLTCSSWTHLPKSQGCSPTSQPRKSTTSTKQASKQHC